jgi:hypothetical protein
MIVFDPDSSCLRAKPKLRTHLPTKHERYLKLVGHMMSTHLTDKLQAAKTYEEAFQILQAHPLHGQNFLAMQHLTDINYSEVIDFDEDAFFVPGPGALDGLQKCFDVELTQGLANTFLEACAYKQEEFFRQFGVKPVTLFGRRLYGIDCRNLCFNEYHSASVVSKSISYTLLFTGILRWN